jgi:hypothetical protein
MALDQRTAPARTGSSSSPPVTWVGLQGKWSGKWEGRAGFRSLCLPIACDANTLLIARCGRRLGHTQHMVGPVLERSVSYPVKGLTPKNPFLDRSSICQGERVLGRP